MRAVTRIISGRAGGQRLATPQGQGTRPTSDRVREALFSRLEHLDVLRGARVLDLYAGSGALGLEAASRGAASVLLVESDRGAAAVARRNVAALGIPGTSVRHATVARTLAAPPPTAFTLVFSDPPYDLPEEALAGDLALDLEPLLPWLADDAVVVVERATRGPAPVAPEGLEPVRDRRYGEATLWYFRRS